MRVLPRTVPTPVVVLTKLAASILAGPLRAGSELTAVPVYVATDLAYEPSAPVHVDVLRLLAVVAVSVALTCLTALLSKPWATATPAPTSRSPATEARIIRRI